MFLEGFVWGMAFGSLITQLIIYVAVRRHRAKVGTPSALHNRPKVPCEHDKVACYGYRCTKCGWESAKFFE